MAAWKLVSPAKLEANRANAQHSTGPRTEEGKTHSAANSRKHGLTAKTVVLDSEEQAEYDHLKAALTKAYGPATGYEHQLLNELADCQWRVYRCRRTETALLDECIKAIRKQHPELSADGAMSRLFSDDTHMKKMRLFLRYQSAIERACAKAQADLREALKARAIAEQQRRMRAALASRQPGFVSQPENEPVEGPASVENSGTSVALCHPPTPPVSGAVTHAACASPRG